MKKVLKYTDPSIPEKVKESLFKKRFLLPLCEVKAFEPDKEMFIEGTANFAAKDRCHEVIEPDAWDLTNYKNVNIILLEHDKNRPIGVCTQLDIDENGLHYRAQIGDPKAGPLTDDQIKARSLLAQKILKANSVGFIPLELEWDEDNELLRYTKVELLEISVVSIPMQQDSLITSVKSFEGLSMKTRKKEQDQDLDQDRDDRDQESKGEEKIDELLKYAKECHEMLRNMEKAFKEADEDEEAEKSALVTENKKLKMELKSLKAEASELMENLREQGLISDEDGE